MKRILCFGDSNTYGYDAFTCGRFGSDIRWTGLLQSALRGSAEVSRELSGAYEALARQRGIAFADAGSWGIQPDFDGTHLTPESHRTFARHVLPMVRWCFGL